MNTLNWLKKKIEDVKTESGDAWATRSVFVNAGDLYKAIAVVEKADKVEKSVWIVATNDKGQDLMSELSDVLADITE